MLNIGNIIRDQTKTWAEKRKKYPIAANFQARLLEARPGHYILVQPTTEPTHDLVFIRNQPYTLRRKAHTMG